MNAAIATGKTWVEAERLDAAASTSASPIGLCALHFAGRCIAFARARQAEPDQPAVRAAPQGAHMRCAVARLIAAQFGWTPTLKQVGQASPTRGARRPPNTNRLLGQPISTGVDIWYSAPPPFSCSSGAFRGHRV